MSKICVEIEMDTDTQQFTVAECPPKDEAMPGEDAGEPAGQAFGSLADAMQAATVILSKGGQQSPDQARQSVMAGYKKAGNRPMPGMGM